MHRLLAEQEAKIELHFKQQPEPHKLNDTLLSDVETLTLELQTTIGSLRSKLDAFSAKVDSIDLSYDKRISNLEATMTPLLAGLDRLPTMAKVHEHLSQELKHMCLVTVPELISSGFDETWTSKIESRVKDIVERDSKDLKTMVRLDLKRLESLMLNSFEHNKSIQSAESAGHDEGRKSFLDLPSLRHSLDSAKADHEGKSSMANLIATTTELRERLEDSEQFVLGTSETVNEKLEEI